MTDEEMDRIVERVSRNVFKIGMELGWYYLQLSQDDDGGTYETPTYEEAVRD
jgi:hypothetical protein